MAKFKVIETVEYETIIDTFDTSTDGEVVVEARKLDLDQWDSKSYLAPKVEKLPS